MKTTFTKLGIKTIKNDRHYSRILRGSVNPVINYRKYYLEKTFVQKAQVSICTE